DERREEFHVMDQPMGTRHGTRGGDEGRVRHERRRGRTGEEGESLAQHSRSPHRPDYTALQEPACERCAPERDKAAGPAVGPGEGYVAEVMWVKDGTPGEHPASAPMRVAIDMLESKLF